jgi:capsid protein
MPEAMNGKPPAQKLTLQERREVAETKLLEEQVRLMEGWLADDFAFGGSDILDVLRSQITQDGEKWAPINIPTDRRGGVNWPLWRTSMELGGLRQKSRILVSSNSFAGGLMRNLTSHVIGKGGTYKTGLIKTIPQENLPKYQPLIDAVQGVVDDHLKRNRWNCGADPRVNYQAGPTREQEIFRRVFRDGESILRAFLLASEDGEGVRADDHGRLLWRFVEPAAVQNQGGDRTEQRGWYLGMKHRTEPYDDLEDIEAYWITYLDQSLRNEESRESPLGEEVPAEQIVHAKNPDEDAIVGRGTPFFAYDTWDAFYRAGRLQKCISLGSAIRASTAEMWEYIVSPAASITGMAAGQGRPVANVNTGQTEYIEARRAGMVRHGPANRKLVPPVQGMVNENLDACQGDLRQAASAACAPEYMVSSDASNANYSSTKEAGTPFVRWAELLQEHFKAIFLACIWKAVRWAVECGVLRPEAMDVVDITCDLPKVWERDALQKAQEDQILIPLGVKDRNTASAERGYDPDTVEQNNAAWNEANGTQTGGMQLPSGGGNPMGGAEPPEPKPPAPSIGTTESLQWFNVPDDIIRLVD